MTPRYTLAAAIRRLNMQLERLGPERQRELMPTWNAEWDALQRQLTKCRTESDSLVAVAGWQRRWSERLGG